MSSSEFELAYLSPGLSIGVEGALVVCVLRSLQERSSFAALREVARGYEGARAQSVALVLLIEADAPLPNPWEREALASAFRSLSGALAASAIVYEGEGFRAAAYRSVVTGLTLVRRQSFAMRIFRHVEEVAAWLPCHSLGLTRARLEDCVRSTRQALDALVSSGASAAEGTA